MNSIAIVSITFVAVVVICVVAVLFAISSISTKRVKSGDRYTVGNRQQVVPDLKFHGRFYHVKEATRENMRTLFKNVSDFLTTHGIDYWIVAGTLLGQVRHEGFIPWDDDIDVGVPRAFQQKIKDAVSSQNQLELRILDRIWKIRQKGKAFPFVDIIWEEEKEGKLCHCMPMNSFGECTWKVHNDWPKEAFPKEWIYPLKLVNFEDFQVFAPNESNLCVIHMFSDKSLTEAKESRWQMRNLPHFFNHKIAATLNLEH